MTAVLERDTTFDTRFATEPYEVAWAGEARWFVQHVGGDGTATYVTQVSPDGITWCDLDEVRIRACRRTREAGQLAGRRVRSLAAVAR